MRRIAFFLWASAAVGQTVAPRSFEVASIKPAPPRVSGRTRLNPGGGEFHENLRGLVAYAYEAQDYQISAPGWLAEARFDVAVRAPEGASAAQFPEMMRTLLAERFNLAVHKEPREFPGYALLVAKDGPRLSAAQPAEPGVRAMFRWGGGGAGKREYKSFTMERLARSLTAMLGRPVIDETHLAGEYDFSLEFTAYETVSGRPTQATDQEPGVSVFRSIQDLGLKLEVRKVAGEMIVVDHVERLPTGN